MSNFVHYKDQVPVNLDLVFMVTQENNDVNFYGANHQAVPIYSWELRTEESAFRVYKSIIAAHSEELD